MRIYNMLMKQFEIVDLDRLTPNHLIVIEKDDAQSYYENKEYFERNPRVFYRIEKKRGIERIKMNSDSIDHECKVGLPWRGDLKKAIETWLDYCEERERLRYV